jgi:hypothetical protein
MTRISGASSSIFDLNSIPAGEDLTGVLLRSVMFTNFLTTHALSGILLRIMATQIFDNNTNANARILSMTGRWVMEKPGQIKKI